MYEAFFSLSARPFADRPDPDFWCETEPHGLALNALRDGLSSLHPLCVVTAESGHGKTVLVRALLRTCGGDVTVGLIATPPGVRDLTRAALLSLGQETVGYADSELRDALALYFVSEYGAGRRCLLVVDEAQHLGAEALASLHRYLDLNSSDDCLLQVVLVGGPDLLKTIRDPLLEGWAERMPLVCPIAALPPAEVAIYVRSRLAVAGALQEIFDDQAIAGIAAASGGVPRLINAICDLAMVYAFAQGTATIGQAIIAHIVSEGHARGFGALAMLAPLAPSIAPEQRIVLPAQNADADRPVLATEMQTVPEAMAISIALHDAVALDRDALQPDETQWVDDSLSVAVEAPPSEIQVIMAEPPHELLDAEREEIIGPRAMVGWPSISTRRPHSSSALTEAEPPWLTGRISLRRRFLPRT